MLLRDDRMEVKQRKMDREGERGTEREEVDRVGLVLSPDLCMSPAEDTCPTVHSQASIGEAPTSHAGDWITTSASRKHPLFSTQPSGYKLSGTLGQQPTLSVEESRDEKDKSEEDTKKMQNKDRSGQGEEGRQHRP